MGGICSTSDTAADHSQRPEKWGRHASLRRMDNSITGSHLPVNMSGANETADDLSPVSRHSGSPTNRSQMLRRIAHLREALSDLRELVATDATLLAPEKGASQVSRDEMARKVTQNEVSKTLLAGRVFDLLHDDKRGLDVKQLQDEFARVGWMTGALELVSSLGKPRDAWNDDVSPVSPTECTDEGLVKRKGDGNAAGSAKNKNLLSPPPRRAIGVHTLSSDDLNERLHHTGSSSPRNLGGISKERFVEEFMLVTFELGVQCLDSEPSVESECPSPSRRRHLLLQKEKPAVLRNYKIQPFCHYPKRIKCIRNQKDSPLIAICMKDSLTAQMYNTVTGECERDYTGHCDCIFDMSISQDRKYLATASRDATLIIWDLVVCSSPCPAHPLSSFASQCGFLVKQFSHPGAVTCCQFGSGHEVCAECGKTQPDPRHPQILSGCYDSAIRKYDLNKGLLKVCTRFHKAPRMQTSLSSCAAYPRAAA